MHQEVQSGLPGHSGVLEIQLMPFKEVCRSLDISPTSAENHVKAGLLPPWVRRGGGKLKTLPPHEVKINKAARMAGKSNNEIKAINISLVNSRLELFNSLASQYAIAT